MHHPDYELAETCWQQLRQGRSSGLSEQEVQEISSKMAVAADVVPNLVAVNFARREAWLATGRLAAGMAGTWSEIDVLWEAAISSAARWLKAAE